MARSKDPARRGVKAPRVAPLRAMGIRPATKAELRAAGLSEKSRRYVTMSRAEAKNAGVSPNAIVGGPRRAGAPPEFLARRQVEQTLVTQKQFEQIARERREASGGKGPLDRYRSLLEDYRENKFIRDRQRALAQSREPPKKMEGIRAIQRDPEFQRILRDLKTKSKAKGSRKMRALEELGRRRPGWTFEVGDTPDMYAYHRYFGELP